VSAQWPKLPVVWQQKHDDGLSARRVKIFQFKSLLTDVFGHTGFASAVDN
jgi:hypothetical protein